MNIPTIGGPRGIFEIFVPGVFLLLNAVATVYFSPFTDDQTKNFLIKELASNAALVLVITICFGYLIGILMRLFRTDLLDKLSSGWLRLFGHGGLQKDGTFRLYTTEAFPYIGWIGEACQLYLPPEALDFYNKTWGRANRGAQNRRFFNFCKLLINSVDEKSANEIYIAEALSRYMVGMFYSLCFSSVLMLINVISVSVVSGPTTSAVLFLIIFFILYLWATSIIVQHFRLIRIKEVETVFDATFVNREKLETLLTSQVEEPRRLKRRRLFWIRERRL